MKRYRIAEIICIVILVVFIGVLSKEETVSDKTLKEVSAAVTANIDTSIITAKITQVNFFIVISPFLIYLFVYVQ